MYKSLPIKLLCLLSFVATNLFGRVTLSFSALYEGSSCSLDSVLIENINNGSRIVKCHPENQFNLVALDIEKIDNLEGEKFELSKNYPNPFYEYCSFDISLPHNERVLITISNAFGEQAFQYERELPAGINHFRLKGSSDNLLFLSAKTDTYAAGIKVIYAGHSSGSAPLVEYLGASANSRSEYRQDEKSNLKSQHNGLAYSLGDSLRFTGYVTRGDRLVLLNRIVDQPTETKEYTFNFVKEKRIAILMYHDLVAGKADDIYERNITDFENDLIYIKDNYQILSMDDLPLLKSGALVLNKDGIIITFDDGYRSTYDLGFPLLKQYNLPATVFVVAEWMDTRPYLDWSEVWLMSEYVNSGNKNLISIGSHTSSHPFLDKRKQLLGNQSAYIDFLQTELGDSKDWIVDITGRPDIFLALPYGDGANNQDVINTAINNGYKGIRTSMWNSFSVAEMNLFALPCIPVLSSSHFAVFESYLDL